MPARVSCGAIKSRKFVNCEKATDLVFGGTRDRWLRREWIFAEVCAVGERGLILHRDAGGHSGNSRVVQHCRRPPQQVSSSMIDA